jgi:DNA-binding MarR family transcriptional regulator
MTSELTKLLRALNILRTGLDDGISAQLVVTFLLASYHPDLGVAELADLAGSNKSTMSRQLLDLSDRLRNGQDGYGVLRRVAVKGDFRAINYEPTPKGKRLLQQVQELMED